MTAPLKRKDIIQAIITNPKLNEEEKSLLVEEFVNEIKNEYPELKYHTTKTDLSELELKLTKEIQDVQLEIKNVDAKLSKEIKELDLKLTKEIKDTKSDILKWSFLFWSSQLAALLGIGFFVYKALHI